MPTMTRRAMLAGTAAIAGAALVGPIFTRRALAARDPFWRLDATAQAELVQSGEASALELVDAAIARIEAIDPAINAVVARSFDQARQQAAGRLVAGPFSGVPYLIKDLDDLGGVRTTRGSRLYADYVADRTSGHVQRSLGAGLISLGKSNTPEFGLLGTTESLQLGVCRNPWDLERTPGGSSGGAGAAVAAGLVPFAHATDGGGSIRIPAACCGLFGLKPSRGRLAPAEVASRADISVQHCVSRSVRDSAALFAATEYTGSDARLPPVGFVGGPSSRRLRIAYSTRTYTGAAPNPEVEIAAQRAAALCEELGHEVVPAAPVVDGERFLEAFMTVWSSGAAATLTDVRRRDLNPDDVLEPWTIGLGEHFLRQSESAMAEALRHFDEIARIYAAFLSRYDAILTPTLAAPPVHIGRQAPTVEFSTLYDRVLSWVAYTPIHNAAGTAAMSVPLAWSAGGLPIGMQFAAAQGDERTLFELAYELERAAPWASRWPELALTTPVAETRSADAAG